MTAVPGVFPAFDYVCTVSTPLLFQTPDAFAAYLADAGTFDAGGPDAGSLIDWTTQTLLVMDTHSHDAFTAGKEGDVLVISVGSLCLGTAPTCQDAAFAVPKVTSVDIVSCPPPSTPCDVP
jgi:hypothetical protein